MSRLAKILFVIAGTVVFGLFVFGGQLVVLVTDGAWFGSVCHVEVFKTLLLARIGLGLVGGLIAFALFQGNAAVAVSRSRGLAPLSSDIAGTPLGRLLVAVPVNLLTGGVSVVLGAGIGLAASGGWQELLLFLHGGSFGWADPIHGLDAGFYVFDLPLIQRVRGLSLGIVVVSGIMAVAIYAVRGAVRLDVVESGGQAEIRGISVDAAVRRHLGVLAAAVAVLAAVGTWLHRYTLLYAQDGLIAGPGTAEVIATLPLLAFEALAGLAAVPLVYLAIARGGRRTVAAAAGLVVLPSLLTAFIPGVVQRFRVAPNELQLQAPYVEDHIAATRFAFGLGEVEERTLSGDAQLTWDDVEANRLTLDNVRLWDHEPLLDTFSQVQEIRTYYNFASVDNDRYLIDGELHQIMLSPRELVSHSLPERAKTWVNETMTYTHGYGLALGPVNEVTNEGLPELWIRDLPPQISFPDDLAIDQPELYFGEIMREPVFVNTLNEEFDYPTGDGAAYTRYEGTGGVQVGGALWRALWAMRLGTSQVLLTSDIQPDSRLLLYRDVRERAAKLAPFLTLDNDPYLVINDGRLTWVLDAYTTAAHFPYAQSLVFQGRRRISWLRSSVKITIDAYDGTITLYAVDPSDPVLAAWRSVLPGLFSPGDQISDTLRAHLRYPQDAFEAQAGLFATYHMTDSQVFYNQEDDWQIPVVGGVRMRPYYTVMKLPGEDHEEYVVMIPFVPRAKENLAAWMVARSDGEHYGELRAYSFPKDRVLYGPSQAHDRFKQDPEISAQTSLWDQRGSQINLGTMLVIPVEESLLYVQPLYLQASHAGASYREEESGSAIPELKRVLVGYDNRIAMEKTLLEGLRKLIVDDPDDPTVVRLPPAPTEGTVAQEATLPRGSATPADALRLYETADAAARAGDWAAYGDALIDLESALRDLAGAEAAEAP